MIFQIFAEMRSIVQGNNLLLDSFGKSLLKRARQGSNPILFIGRISVTLYARRVDDSLAETY
jgi:hypothetical protein